MAEKEKIYNLGEIVEELRASKGLPKNLSTEAQLWDEIFKKEAFLMPEQLFPLIREIYGTDYPRDAPVSPLATEYPVERSGTKKISSIRADITVLIDSMDIYHFECESRNDNSMVIRMFEYDVHISLSYTGKPAELKFPRSAVLYLQENRNLPDELSCSIRFQDGGIYKYKVPAVKVQTYSLEEIRDKHLSILIPFLPLRFRRFLTSPKNRRKFSKEELTSFYRQIILILDEEVEKQYLSENNRNILLNLLNKSFVRVFYRDESLLKEVVVMTEPILELEIEKYIYMLDTKMDELEKVKDEYERVNDELTVKMNELDLSKKELDRNKKELDRNKKELDQNKKELDQNRKELDRNKKELTQNRKELNRSNRENLQLQNENMYLKKQLAELQRSGNG